MICQCACLLLEIVSILIIGWCSRFIGLLVLICCFCACCFSRFVAVFGMMVVLLGSDVGVVTINCFDACIAGWYVVNC